MAGTAMAVPFFGANSVVTSCLHVPIIVHMTSKGSRLQYSVNDPLI